MFRSFINSSIIAHLISAACALFYAWHIAQSAYVQTGLQFVAPLLIVVTIHLIWISISSRGLAPGFSALVYRRSFQTALGMFALLLFLALVAPLPTEASIGGTFGGVLFLLFCGCGIVAVAFVLSLIIRAIAWCIETLINGFDNNDGPENRLFDFGSIAVVTIVLAFGSLEGLPHSYSFETDNRTAVSRFINTSSTHVWNTMETATSPEFPLPAILGLFPLPVAVVTDEGNALGAIRKVKFQGREGTGYLTLKVVERTATRAVFKVLSDSSPHANWVEYSKLIYEVQPEGDGSRLTVALEYKRTLAPAWFFTPVVKGAANLAMGVLASDVQFRSEE